eukprot:3807662-Pleurochrysis_carterae.AAC.1
MPGLADFAVDTKDKSKPRFNLDEAKMNVDIMIAKQPGFFNKLHKESWDHLFKEFSQRIKDVVETDAPRFTESDLPQCWFGLADCSALYNHQ